MPIKLIAPRKGFSPYYYGRGTYLGQFVNRSTGVDRAAIAKRVIKEWEREIERGRFDKTGPSFTDAAVAYIKAGGDRRPLAKLIACSFPLDCGLDHRCDDGLPAVENFCIVAVSCLPNSGKDFGAAAVKAVHNFAQAHLNRAR